MSMFFGRSWCAALRIHRNDFPANQFEALVLINDACLHHCLDLGHGPAPPHQPFGGLRGGRKPGRSELLVHDIKIASTGQGANRHTSAGSFRCPGVTVAEAISDILLRVKRVTPAPWPASKQR